MEERSWSERAAILVCVVLFGGLAYLSLRYLLPALFPLFAGILLAFAARNLAARASKKIPVGVLAVVILTLLLFFVGLLLFALARRLLAEGQAFLSRLPEIQSAWNDLLERIFGMLEKLLGEKYSLQSEAKDWLPRVLERLLSGTTALLGNILSGAPDVFFSLVVCLIVAYGFASEGFSLLSSLAEHLPQRVKLRIPAWKSRFRGVSFQYLRAYFLLFLITFLELFVGLLILGVDYVFLLSLLIAFVDILPILGTGTVLLPWGIALLFGGDVGKGIGLLILYLIITLVRQFAEPHILGKSLGLHPLLTLFSSYLGWRCFGVSGLLLAPLLLLVVRGMIFPKKEPHA